MAITQSKRSLTHSHVVQDETLAANSMDDLGRHLNLAVYNDFKCKNTFCS